MKRTLMLQEMRQMQFKKLYRQVSVNKLTIEEAATLLDIHERTFRRWVTRYQECADEGLQDKRIGRAAHNAAPVDETLALLELYENNYAGFTAAHFYDKYRDDHGGQRGYTWVKNCLQESGHLRKAKKRGAHRRKRPRCPMKGMMLHQDGSTHQWVDAREWDLIVTLDDADSEIYSAFFVEEEGTQSSFQGVKEVIVEHGLFCFLYVDRGSHYWSTPKAGGKVAPIEATQFGRAMKRLGIDMIAAYSPEARGRSERMFGTIQGRLPKELKLEGITEMEKANKYLKEKFIPKLNQRFMVKPTSEDSAFVPWLTTNMNIDDILCIQEERTVRKDNTVSYSSRSLQIPRNKFRYSYAKTKVVVHEYADSSLSVFHGPRQLASYTKSGELITEKEQVKIRQIY